MALQKTYTQIEWSTADSISVSSGSNSTSDEMTPAADAISLMVQCKADNGGTPASGDVVDIYILRTLGDPDADPDSADEFATVDHAEWVATLDTNEEDPAIAVKSIPIGGKKYKFYAVNNASSNSITVSIQVEEVDEA